MRLIPPINLQKLQATLRAQAKASPSRRSNRRLGERAVPAGRRAEAYRGSSPESVSPVAVPAGRRADRDEVPPACRTRKREPSPRAGCGKTARPVR